MCMWVFVQYVYSSHRGHGGFTQTWSWIGEQRSEQEVHSNGPITMGCGGLVGQWAVCAQPNSWSCPTGDPQPFLHWPARDLCPAPERHALLCLSPETLCTWQQVCHYTHIHTSVHIHTQSPAENSWGSNLLGRSCQPSKNTLVFEHPFSSQCAVWCALLRLAVSTPKSPVCFWCLDVDLRQTTVILLVLAHFRCEVLSLQITR